MIVVSVLYPKTEKSRFDFDYYLAKHVPLVKARFEPFGMEETRLMRGTATLDGSKPAFELIAELTFPSTQHLQSALLAHGDEIIRDVPMFTDVQPTIQINEAL
jgi:uncharacterized protein (TIGR02118 family)